MAKLPPKIPSTKLGWSEEIPCGVSFSPDNADVITKDPFWVDEFDDFTSPRSQAQCRLVSDYITFLDDPELQVNSRNVRPRFEAVNEFDKFDDENFISMFDYDESEAANPPSSSPKSSSPSDHKSNEDENQITNQIQQHQNLHNWNEEQQQWQHLKNEPSEAENQMYKQQKIQPSNNLLATSSPDKISDPKRVKR